MALIMIMMSCVLGFMAGLVQFAILDAGFGQAFVTYFGVSVALSTVSVIAILVYEHFADAAAYTDGSTDLEAWQDWQVEEAMAERFGATSDDTEDGLRRSA
jgi:hypothetical protein